MNLPPLGGPCVTSRSQVVGYGTHRFDNILIAGAAAKIRRQNFNELVFGKIRVALEGPDNEHEKTRRAKATLQRVVFNKSVLKNVKRIALGKILHRPNTEVGRLVRKHKARSDGLAID
jgi:hypothetical protein